jgi:hypothetical protein
MKRKNRRKQSAIIRYGKWKGGKAAGWRVRTTDATSSVKIDGTFMDAIKSCEGVSIGCHLSNVAQNNEDKFPHPCILVAFVKTRCYVVDKTNKLGVPIHAVRYSHDYADWVDLNDTDHNKDKIRHNPHIAERSFILSPPPKYKPQASRRPNVRRIRTGTQQPRVARGALQRAKKAGLVADGVPLRD